MSQPSITTFGSCGLMAGRRVVPPPPGPMTRHASRRTGCVGPSGTGGATATAAAAAAARNQALMPGTREGARGCAARSPPTGGGAPRGAGGGGGALPGGERVQERGRLAIEAAELEELRSVSAHASAHLGRELPFRE